jgi:hypothetical protein
MRITWQRLNDSAPGTVGKIFRRDAASKLLNLKALA